MSVTLTTLVPVASGRRCPAGPSSTLSSGVQSCAPQGCPLGLCGPFCVAGLTAEAEAVLRLPTSLAARPCPRWRLTATDGAGCRHGWLWGLEPQGGCRPAGVGLGPEDPLLDGFRSCPSPGGRHLVPVWLTARPGESGDWCQPAVGWVSPQC